MAEDTSLDEKTRNQYQETIIDNLRNIWTSIREQTTSIVVSTTEQIKHTIDTQSIIQSQLGPLTPIALNIYGHFKDYTKRALSNFREFFVKYIWNSKKFAAFRKWFRESVWERTKKGLKGLLGLALFIPVLLLTFIKEGPLKFAKFVGVVLWNIIGPPIKLLSKLSGKFLGFLAKPLLKFETFRNISAFFQRFRAIFAKKGEAELFRQAIKRGGVLGRILLKFIDITTAVLKPFKTLFNIFGKIITLKLPGLGFARAVGKALGRLFIPLQVILSIVDFLKGWAMAEEIFGEGAGIKEKIISGISGLISGIISLPVKLLDWVLTKLGVESNLARFVDVESIARGIKWIVDIVISGMNKVKDFFEWFGVSEMGFLGRIFFPITIIINLAGKIYDKLAGLVEKLLAWAGIEFDIPSFSDVKEIVSGLMSRALERVKEFFEGSDLLMTIIDPLTSGIKDLFSGIGSWIKEKVGWEGIKEFLRGPEEERVPEKKPGLVESAKMFWRDVTETGGEKPIKEAQEGALITKTGIIKVHEGEIVAPIEKLAPMMQMMAKPVIPAREGEVANKVVEITKSFEKNITKTIQDTAQRVVMPPAPTDVTLGNTPIIVEDTGLILVSSGII